MNAHQNDAVFSEIRAHEDAIRALRARLTPTQNLETDLKTGWLKTEVIYRADITATVDDIIKARESGRLGTLLDDAHPREYAWDEFLKLVEKGYISDYDGSADLVVDGLVSDSDALWITTEMYVIFDRYFVPFSRVTDVFKDHDIKVYWFNN